MTAAELEKALAGTVGVSLARELVRDFLMIRQDVLTGTLERANAGKFVESVVQALQSLERGGKYDEKPSVDDYLTKMESRPGLSDDLRIVMARVCRAMYTLRNKRNIAHKGAVDPNIYDLKFLHDSAQWVMAEMLRNSSGLSMADAGRLVEGVQEPVGGLVEDLGSRKLVLKAMAAHEEALVLLKSVYPTRLTVKSMIESMDRRSPNTVRNAMRRLWTEKLADDSGGDGYKLTKAGVDAAAAVVRRVMMST